MFLSVKGARSGVIKGEAHDSKHLGEIDVVSWSWGIQGRPSLGGGKPSGQASIRELKILKRVDRASTALMAAVRTNEPISKAVLTVRKSGKSPLEFLKITIEQGRVTGISIEAGNRDQAPELFEDVTFSFNKITVEYTEQGADGLGTGSTVFADQFDENS
jgi:type VI secretion system secreted protein Hcp